MATSPSSNDHCHRQPGTRATGPVKPLHQKLHGEPFYGGTGSQRPQKVLNARERRRVTNGGLSSAGPNPPSPQHHCRAKTRTKKPRDQAESCYHESPSRRGRAIDGPSAGDFGHGTQRKTQIYVSRSAFRITGLQLRWQGHGVFWAPCPGVGQRNLRDHTMTWSSGWPG